MKKNKINKKIPILLFFVAVFAALGIYFFVFSPIYFISDLSYIENEINVQKKSLSFEAIKRGKRLEVIEVDNIDENFLDSLKNEKALVIFSPLFSSYISSKEIEISNPYVLLGVNDDKKALALYSQNNLGWEKVANLMSKRGRPLYVLYDNSWINSEERAHSFINNYKENLITTVVLEGNEMQQSASSMLYKMQKENIQDLVIAGTSLINEINYFNKSAFFVIPSNLFNCVDRRKVNYVIYYNLAPVIGAKGIKGEVINLSQAVLDCQGGLKNFFQLLWLDFYSRLF